MVSDKEGTVSEQSNIASSFSESFLRVLGFLSAIVLTGMVITGVILLVSEDPGYEHTSSQSHTEYTHENLDTLITSMDDVITDNNSLLERIRRTYRSKQE